MTDRVKGLVITLDKDYREDDIQFVIDLIGQIKGVALVEKIKTNIGEDHINRNMVRMELMNKIYKVLE